MLLEGKVEYHVPCGTGAMVKCNRVLVCSVCGKIIEFNRYNVNSRHHISEFKYCPECGSGGDE